MTKAALFDLDGTLIDSEKLWAQSLCTYLNSLSIKLDLEDSFEIINGRAYSHVFKIINSRFKKYNLDSIEVEKGMRYYFRQMMKSSNIAINPSVEKLKSLSKSIFIAIVSGSPREDIFAAMDYLKINSNVNLVIGSEDYQEGKPSPECFLLAAKKLNVLPSECIVFEDSDAGITAAKKADMLCVALKKKFLKTNQIADYYVDALTEFDL